MTAMQPAKGRGRSGRGHEATRARQVAVRGEAQTDARKEVQKAARKEAREAVSGTARMEGGSLPQAVRLRLPGAELTIWRLLRDLGPRALTHREIVASLRMTDRSLTASCANRVITGLEKKGRITADRSVQGEPLYRVKPVPARKVDGPATVPAEAAGRLPGAAKRLAARGAPGQGTGPGGPGQGPTRTRPSYSRHLILNLLASADPAALSRSEVHRRLLLDGCAISLSSVYRMLDELERKGAVLSEPGADRETLYRVKPGGFDALDLGFADGATGARVKIEDRALLGRLLAIARDLGLEITGKVVTVRLEEGPGSDAPDTD